MITHHTENQSETKTMVLQKKNVPGNPVTVWHVVPDETCPLVACKQLARVFTRRELASATLSINQTVVNCQNVSFNTPRRRQQQHTRLPCQNARFVGFTQLHTYGSTYSTLTTTVFTNSRGGPLERLTCLKLVGVVELHNGTSLA